MQSTRYAIAQTLFASVQAVAVAEGAGALFSPRLPIDPKGKPNKLLFVVDRGDKLIEQTGQREKRRVRIVLGALVLAGTAVDAEVDALHFAARAALKAQALRATLIEMRAPMLREVEVEPELKEAAIEGALLMSAFEIEYLETYPSA